MHARDNTPRWLPLTSHSSPGAPRIRDDILLCLCWQASSEKYVPGGRRAHRFALQVLIFEDCHAFRLQMGC
jgi:hypothetical protein